MIKRQTHRLFCVVIDMKNVMRIDFEIGCCNSDGELVPGTEHGVCVLYNSTVISEDEVRKLIRSGMYEYDNRLVVTTPIQADNLKSR